MPIIDWNDLRVELEPYEAAGYFLRVLLAAARRETLMAISWLDTLNRTALEELADPSTYPPTVSAAMTPLEILNCLSLLGEKINGNWHGGSEDAPKSIRSSEGTGVASIEWIGHHTPGRTVTLMYYKESDLTVILIRTGTGKPSQFLRPLCQLAIAQASREVAEATEYFAN